MKARTYMSTDWIEVHDFELSYFAKVFLTPEGKAYLLVTSRNRIRFFQVDKKLLRLGEIGFFQKVMEDSKEMPVEQVLKMGLIRKG